MKLQFGMPHFWKPRRDMVLRPKTLTHSLLSSRSRRWKRRMCSESFWRQGKWMRMVQPNSWKIWDVLMMSWIIDDDAFICVYYIYIWLYMIIYVHVYMYSLNLRDYVCTFIIIYIYIYMYVCMYMYWLVICLYTIYIYLSYVCIYMCVWCVCWQWRRTYPCIY